MFTGNELANFLASAAIKVVLAVLAIGIGVGGVLAFSGSTKTARPWRRRLRRCTPPKNPVNAVHDCPARSVLPVYRNR